MPVPFLDLKAQHRQIAEEVRKELDEVMESTAFVLGPKVKSFEERFASLCGTKHCVALSSGTAAVHSMIWASGLPAGSGVILPPNTFTATAEGVILAGHVPVFVDAMKGSWNLCPHRTAGFLEETSSSGRPVDPRTGSVIRAILPVDLYGQPADLPAFERLASRWGLMLFEDACQAHAASLGGRPAGSFGDAAAFSFYPGKNLGAYGEGGAVTTNSDELAAAVRTLRDHGSSEKYFYSMIGHNYRMEGFQGAVLGVKLSYLQDWTAKRREAAKRYGDLLSGLPLELPFEEPGAVHVYHLYAVHTRERRELGAFLKERGIATGLHYPYPLHLQKAYSYLGYSEGDFPVSEYNSARNITLPIFAEITALQQAEVAEGIRAFFAG
jgi:dTDP-4-amino-4,6-dideoxygalactose transaminase